MEQKTKAWYLSKTVWLNLVSFLALAISLLEEDSWVKHNPQMMVRLGTILTFCNLVLRISSKSVLTVSQKSNTNEVQKCHQK